MFTTNIDISNNLIKEANKALEEREYYKAKLFCEEASRFNPQNPISYLIQILIEYKVTEIEELKNCNFDFNSEYYRRLRLYADEELNNELDKHLSKMESFVDYKNNSIDDDEPGNIERDKLDNNEFDNTNSEIYESGNIEEENINNNNTSNSYSSRKIENNPDDVKKIGFSGDIVARKETENRVDECAIDTISKIDDTDKEQSNSTSIKNEYDNKKEETFDNEYTEKDEDDYKSQVLYEANREKKRINWLNLLNRFFDYLFDITPPKTIKTKINTPMGKKYLADANRFTSNSFALTILFLIPVIFYIVFLPLVLLANNERISTIISLFTTIFLIIRLVKTKNFNFMLYYKQENINNYSSFHYFINGIIKMLMAVIFYLLTISAYWYASYLSLEKPSLLIFSLLLGILGQKFIYYFYKNNYYSVLNYSYCFKRLFNKS